MADIDRIAQSYRQALQKVRTPYKNILQQGGVLQDQSTTGYAAPPAAFPPANPTLWRIPNGD